MLLEEIIQNKREELLQIAAKHGAHHLRIFGSVARGEARPDSDVDILVELEPGRSLLDHAALMLDLEQVLGCKVDVATLKGLRPHIREQVLKEAVLV
jgi:predicted nucleotidyltransferase